MRVERMRTSDGPLFGRFTSKEMWRWQSHSNEHILLTVDNVSKRFVFIVHTTHARFVHETM